MEKFVDRFCEDAVKSGLVMTDEIKMKCRDAVETVKREMSDPKNHDRKIIGFYRGLMFEADAEDCLWWAEVDGEYIPIENVGVVVGGEIVPLIEYLAKEAA